MLSVSRLKAWSKHSLVTPALTHCKVMALRTIEGTRVCYRYYRSGRFLLLDCALRARYLFCSPYRTAKRFAKERGEEDLYTYGETSLTTLDHIAKTCAILSKDRIYELGCGTGRGAFWFHTFVGCRVVGIDWAPEFINRANRIKHLFHLSKVTFRNEDMLTTDFREATVIYLAGTSLPDATLKALVKRLARLRRGTKVITVSFPLTDYSQEPLFRVVKQFKGNFLWGKADIYLQVRL